MTCFKLSTGETLHHACKRLGLNYYQACKWFDRDAMTSDEALKKTLENRGNFGCKHRHESGISYYQWFLKNKKYMAYPRFLYYAKKYDLETALKKH